MEKRTVSFESVSTASDATIQSWSAEDAEIFEQEQLDLESIPLRSFGEEANFELSGTVSRLHRSWHSFPMDAEKAVHFFGALFSILILIALLPWLAGQSLTPVKNEVVTTNTSRVLATSPSSTTVIPTNIGQR